MFSSLKRKATAGLRRARRTSPPPETRRNQSAVVAEDEPPIMRLSNELLVEVFMCLRHHSSIPSPLASLRNLCLVSNRWRRIILDTPMIWATFSMEDEPVLIEIALRRSDDAPLTMRSIPPPVYPTPTPRVTNHPPWSEILQQVHRWEDVDVQVLGFSPQAFAVALRTPAPMLKRLHMHASNFHPLAFLRLFEGEAPLLRDLKLDFIGIVWDDRVVRGLRSLELRLPFDCSLSDVVINSILSSNPMLEYLALEEPEDAEAQYKFEPTPDPVLFDLVQLRQLRLNVRPSTLAPLLHQVSAPQCISLNITTTGPHSGIRGVFNTLVSFLERSPLVQAQVATSHIRCSPNRFEVVDDDHSGYLHLDLVCMRYGGGYGPLELTGQLCAIHGLQGGLHVTYDEVENPKASIAPDNVMRRFSKFNNVESFSAVRCVDVDALLEAMGQLQPSGWILPNLKRLNVARCYVTPQILLDMVVRRYGQDDGPTKLEALEVVSSYQENPGILSQLDEVLGKGVVTWRWPAYETQV